MEKEIDWNGFQGYALWPLDFGDRMQKTIFQCLGFIFLSSAAVANEEVLDVHARDIHGETLLHHCSEPDRIDVLIDLGADLNAKNSWGETPLFKAVSSGAPKELIEKLIDRGASLNVYSSYGSTCLHSALSRGDEDVFFLLARRGADLFILDGEGRTLLEAAVSSCYKKPEIIAYLLQNGFSPNSPCKDSLSPLHLAVQEDDFETVRLLIVAGADVNFRGGRWYKETPLHLAVQREALDLVQLLIQSGADVCAKREDHKSSLHLSAENDTTEIAQLLLEQGANIHQQDLKGTTPLGCAISAFSIEHCRLFLEHQANPNQEQFDGKNYLHLLAAQSFYDRRSYETQAIVEMLFDYNIDLNKKDFLGATPLHCAAQDAHFLLFRQLLDHGADVHALDCLLQTPLHYATWSGHSWKKIKPILEALAEKGVNFNAKEEKGLTPLHFAVMNSNSPVVKWLLQKGADPMIENNEGLSPFSVVLENKPYSLTWKERTLLELFQSKNNPIY